MTAYVADHPGRTAEQIALAVRARLASVREILASPFFEATLGANHAKVYELAAAPRATGRAGKAQTHKARVLRLLQDGRPHGHMEGYRLGVMLHSRVADLRRDGYEIRCWREGDDYLYQLVGLLEATAGVQSSGCAAATGVDPASAVASSGPVLDIGNPGSTVGDDGGAAQLVLTGPEFRRKVA